MSNVFINSCLQKCLSGVPLKKKEIVRLLDIEIGSREDRYMQSCARLAAKKITGNSGCIWCAVGMDYEPCSMNCKFCSFGERWGLIDEPGHVSKEDIIEYVRQYVAGGAAYIVLRTTEFYNLDFLLTYVPAIREAVPGDYGIIFNTGELDGITAERVNQAGVYGVYHALRLREGHDTPFEPKVRINTMQSVAESGLTLAALVEPLGYEHTNEEIADIFLNAVCCGAQISGVMARFPVRGTPLGEAEMIDEAKIAHVVAALRLSGGKAVRDICVHPASKKALDAGANLMVVESGAIPRDSKFSKAEWLGMNMEKARDLLTGSGYKISSPPARRTNKFAKCACTGNNLEKFMQPIILHILSGGSMTGYRVCKQISNYITYSDNKADMSATYRYLKQMKERGLLEERDGTYSISESGKECLENWKDTLNNYQNTLKQLLKQLK